MIYIKEVNISHVVDTEEFISTLQQAARILNKRSAIVRTKDDLLAVGDVHGDMDSTSRAIMLRDKLQLDQVVFIGDFVDRGAHQTETLMLLTRELIRNPSHTQLVRGNHEDLTVNYEYGFLDDLQANGIDVKAVNKPLGEFYSSLPIALIKEGVALLAHGGIPYYDGKVDINSYQKFGPIVEKTHPHMGILWNDPAEAQNIEVDRFGENFRGPRAKTYSEKAVEEFISPLGLKMLIRAHVVQKNGYTWYNNHTLSIFSANSGRYSGINIAYANVTDSVEIVR